MKPTLFILKMPFKDDSGKEWFCSHCALIEGALIINTHWKEHIDIKRIGSLKPRKEIIEVLGEENQWMPVLVLENKKTITNPIEITKYLSQKYGGAAPHP